MLVTVEGRAVKVGLHVRLRVRETGAAGGPPLRERLDAMYADLVAQESGNPALLDSDMNATLASENAATVEVRLTVEAVDAGRAVDEGLGCLRAAVRAAGIDPAVVTEESVDASPLADAADQ
jgi:hypothetical protein